MADLSEYLLCFDFDGTLHSNVTKPPVGLEFRQFLENLVNMGITWGINTGRSFELLAEGLETAKFLSDPHFIVSREREVFFKTDKDSAYVEDEAWKECCESKHREMYLREAAFFETVSNYVLSKTSAEWVSEPGDEAGVVANSLEEMEQILAFVDEKLKSTVGVAYLRSTIYMRFTHVDFHKGTSLAYVSKQMGISREKVFAMGDGENDMGMLHSGYAGMVACPANAVPHVKRLVSNQLGYIAQDEVFFGVEEALLHFFPIVQRNS